MPAYFTLTKKDVAEELKRKVEAGELKYIHDELVKAATPLSQIDEDICRYLDHPVNNKKYAFSWYNSIGYLLAAGRTFDEIVQFAKDEDAEYNDIYTHKTLAIALYLREYYVPNSWYQVK